MKGYRAKVIFEVIANAESKHNMREKVEEVLPLVIQRFESNGFPVATKDGLEPKVKVKNL